MTKRSRQYFTRKRQLKLDAEDVAWLCVCEGCQSSGWDEEDEWDYDDGYEGPYNDEYEQEDSECLTPNT